MKAQAFIIQQIVQERYFRGMFRTIIIGGLLFTASALNAQAQHDRTCSAQSLTQQYLQAQGLSTNLLDALPRVDLLERGGTYTVPVVVHVVYNTSAENVSTGTIQGIIDELNADYSQSNTDIGSVRSQFTSSIGNVGFNFCLAQLDPNGAATTGITRTQTSQTWFDPDNETNAMKTAADGHAPWNTNRYLNIWICDISSGASGGLITVGYAYLPVGGVVGSNIDGLVIDYSYGTQPGDRTATHEIGHYFGLQHTFDDGGACVNADGFADTPTTNSPTFSCSNTSLMKCGVLTQYENFMDYASCSRMFTNQQASYMGGVLSGVRSQLLNNNACVTTPIGYCTPTSAAGTAEGDFINGVQLGTINNVNSGSTTGPSYTNYTATLSTSLARGSSQTITITGGSYQPDNYAAWIDYDGDQIFEASEKLGEFATTTIGQTQTINFVVPAGAALGNTRMRVRGVFHNQGEPTPTDPCFNYAFGETEDYRITITSPVVGPCIPTSQTGPAQDDFIDGVQLGSINNVNSGSNTGPSYNNYISSFSTSLVRGSNQTITITAGDYQPDNYAAWIDYDQDDSFEASEKLGEFATTAIGETQTINFAVPAGALLGNTVLRVRGVYHANGEPAPTDPCYAYGFGETEDYGITITSPVAGPCIPTSTAGPTDGDYINSVNLAAINNSNTGGSDGPTYTNYVATHSTPLGIGTQQTLTIEGGSYEADNYAAWIDYDQDDTFEASEKLGEVATTSAGEIVSITFNIPGSAIIGATRMRVRGAFHLGTEPTPTDPCFDYAYGETEDYGIIIDTSTDLEKLSPIAMEVYPNPTSGSLTLVMPGSIRSSITILDLQGRSVHSSQENGQVITMDLSTLSEGVYLLRVQQGSSFHTQRVEVLRKGQ